jgi:hypothetical protein
MAHKLYEDPNSREQDGCKRYKRSNGRYVYIDENGREFYKCSRCYELFQHILDDTCANCLCPAESATDFVLWDRYQTWKQKKPKGE